MGGVDYFGRVSQAAQRIDTESKEQGARTE
jgi:hypothetical protein